MELFSEYKETTRENVVRRASIPGAMCLSPKTRNGRKIESCQRGLLTEKEASPLKENGSGGQPTKRNLRS